MNKQQMEIANLNRAYKLNNYLFFFLVGAILNITVVVSNGNAMPVFYSIEETVQNLPKDYIAFTDTDEVRYPYLSDYFKVGTNNRALKFSVGDLIMAVSFIMAVGILIQGIIIQRRYKHGVIRIK